MTHFPLPSGPALPIRWIGYHGRRTKEYAQRIWNVHMAGTQRSEILMELFVGLNRFLEECGVDHWVNFGTLLGFHRQGALLDHDIDIDMGCLEKDAARVWDARHRLPHGWVLHDTSFRHHGPKFYVSHRGFDGDIYFYREQGESLLPLEKTRWANYRRPIPRDLLLPTEMRQWVSEAPASSSSSDSSGFSSFRVPARVEDYLTFIYGSLAPDAKRDPESGFWV